MDNTYFLHIKKNQLLVLLAHTNTKKVPGSDLLAPVCVASPQSKDIDVRFAEDCKLTVGVDASVNG